MRHPWTSARVLVTGASSGIGEALALGLAKRGAIPILVARRGHKLTAIAERIRHEYGITAPIIVADLGEPEDRARVMKEAGLLDGLFACAGLGSLDKVHLQTLTQHRHMIELNILGTVELIHAALPAMRARRQGWILTVASTAAFQSNPSFATYGATKAFILNWSLALRQELRPVDVHVNCLCPGPTGTAFFAAGGIPWKDIPALQHPMELKHVVTEAFAGLESNQAIIIPGLRNSLLNLLTRFVSRQMAARIASWALVPARHRGLIAKDER